MPSISPQCPACGEVAMQLVGADSRPGRLAAAFLCDCGALQFIGDRVQADFRELIEGDVAQAKSERARRATSRRQFRQTN